MLVSHLNSNTNALTVTRGLNGTRTMSHSDRSTVWAVRWPAPVERAALIQAARMWTRAPDFQPFYVDADLGHRRAASSRVVPAARGLVRGGRESADMTERQPRARTQSPMRFWLRRIAHAFGAEAETASSRAAATDVFPRHRAYGLGSGWTPTSYADYYAASVPVYAAVTRRAEAMSRTPFAVERLLPDGERVPVGPEHEIQRLLDRPNSWMTGAELRFATEVNLNLWGLAYWAIETDGEGRAELWPVRPDRLVPLPGEGRTYVKGYVYRGLAGDAAYLPREIVSFGSYNPLQDRTGLSPIAPLRLSLDMAKDAARYKPPDLPQRRHPRLHPLRRGRTDRPAGRPVSTSGGRSVSSGRTCRTARPSPAGSGT